VRFPEGFPKEEEVKVPKLGGKLNLLHGKLMQGKKFTSLARNCRKERLTAQIQTKARNGETQETSKDALLAGWGMGKKVPPIKKRGGASRRVKNQHIKVEGSNRIGNIQKKKLFDRGGRGFKTK